ncbi:GlcG/HbpS family heme-binding protein [Methylomonas sp. MED-D]|uniref:Heme-binding protein n=1 Tax=Methylomonas koyamae TaxID=702114 RepID=A0A177NJ22_9GAMM|nr:MULTISPECIES: heme-binding protein [Methylomonas]NJA08507.1 heme-binding protein [Methylococcaceae bacterium WWC4]MDT4329404.1 heme-binding protein [Methylomonas sp. MV1]OAI17977.1 hypothetical protein A1355_06535 [Methylomonas koyamae]OHX38089.1 hypothetical protein BJL95_23040 [Methylomonas sp. LWB]WGS87415.1 heme-binding protein [Methylomonas sp. UP202]
MKTKKLLALSLGSAALVLSAQTVSAACSDVSRSALTDAISAAEAASTGGYGLNMWVTVVDETGKVCHVATSGTTGSAAGNSEWLGSRVISAQKAFTANAFSLDGYAISTGNLYSAVQPGGSLYGLQHSNPVDASRAYAGSPNAYGTNSDPLKNKRVGGVNVFGGGLAIYSGGHKVGAIGVSGDTSCRDHAYAWRVREALGMHPAGTGITTSNMNAAGTAQTALTGAAKGDELILTGTGGYWDAWSQPACPNSTPTATTANGTLQAP